MLEFKYLDFTLLGGGVERYGAKVGEEGSGGGRRGGDGDGEGMAEDGEIGGGVEVGLCV